MSNKEQYEKRTEALILPLLEKRSFELYDIEYVKEGGDFYLRVYIDKPGGITIDDCVDVSREMNEILDREDYIKDAYTFEVSSPGLSRPLKKEKDFKRAVGKAVEVHTFRAIEKQKQFIGELLRYTDDSVTIKAEEGEMEFPKKNISLIRLYVDF